MRHTLTRDEASVKSVSSFRVDPTTKRRIKVLAALTGETQGDLIARLVGAEFDTHTVGHAGR